MLEIGGEDCRQALGGRLIDEWNAELRLAGIYGRKGLVVTVSMPGTATAPNGDLPVREDRRAPDP